MSTLYNGFRSRVENSPFVFLTFQTVIIARVATMSQYYIVDKHDREMETRLLSINTFAVLNIK